MTHNGPVKLRMNANPVGHAETVICCVRFAVREGIEYERLENFVNTSDAVFLNSCGVDAGSAMIIAKQSLITTSMLGPVYTV